jgi:cyclopropane-fatty-acyl-phospholipid synthase
VTLGRIEPVAARFNGRGAELAVPLEPERKLGEAYMTATLDRLVSVGMFEHVGVAFYHRFFRTCAQLLADDGVMVLHAIGRSEGPGVTNPWIAK